MLNYVMLFCTLFKEDSLIGSDASNSKAMHLTKIKADAKTVSKIKHLTLQLHFCCTALMLTL